MRKARCSNVSSDMQAPGPLILERVTVTKGRIRMDVRLREGAPPNTSPFIADEALRKYPSLAKHSCINSKGPSFGDVIDNTSVPHLLEHMVIAEQARLTCTATTYVGTTELRDNRSACVEISFTDDLVAMKAIRNALSALAEICNVSPQPNCMPTVDRR